MTRWTWIIWPVLALLVFGCRVTGPEGSAPEVVSAWARPASRDGNGAVFLVVRNPGSEADRLTGADADVAMAVELHETMNDGGVMRMRPRPAGFELPARGELQLAPGGKHIMLMGLTRDLAPGDTFTVTLKFARAGEIPVRVVVKRP